MPTSGYLVIANIKNGICLSVHSQMFSPPYPIKALKAVSLIQQEIMPVFSINYKNNLVLIIEVHEP